jgi:hypothetical protein
MRKFFSIVLALVLAGCLWGCKAAEEDRRPQPHVPEGATVIALAIVPPEAGAGSTQCRAKVSRDPALVARGKHVIWEIIDLCNEQEREVSIKLVGGNLPVEVLHGKGKIKKKQADYFDVKVGNGAQSQQYKDYEIYLETDLLADPRIQVP